VSPESSVLQRRAVPDDVARLLSPEGAADLLRRSRVDVERAEPEYVRLKPGIGALVAYRLSGRGPGGEHVELPGYVRGLSPPRAAALARKWSRMRPTETPLGPGVRLLEDGRSVLFLFPNDARLRGLRFVADIDKLKRILGELPELRARGLRARGRRSSLTPIRYKPERRLIAHADLRVTGGERGERLDVFLRFFPDARGARIARSVKALRDQAGVDLLPRPLGAAFDGRLFVEERVPGREVLQAVVDGTADGAALAAALRRLHQARPPGGLSSRTPAALLSALSEGLDVMTSVEPGLRPAAHALVEALRPMVPHPSPATIHGDLHLHQVLIGEVGPVLVDLERAAVGHPLQDVGELVAHLQELSEEERPEGRHHVLAFRDSFLDGYLDERPADGLAFFVGAALGNRALLPFRRVEPGWTERSEARLALARSALQDG
jgi:hypothetical protein